MAKLLKPSHFRSFSSHSCRRHRNDRARSLWAASSPSSRVARSGETFNMVAFGCIRLHFPIPRTLILAFSPWGVKEYAGLGCEGNDGGRSGVRRSGETFNRFHFLPFPPIPHRPTRGWMRGSPSSRGATYANNVRSQRGYGVMGSCRWFGRLGNLFRVDEANASRRALPAAPLLPPTRDLVRDARRNFL